MLPADGFGVDEINIVPWPILLRRRLARKVGIDRRWAIVMVLLSGLFTVGFTITILVVSLERIATDLNSDVVTMNWSITGPMLAFGVVGPAFGKAGDLWGHKGLFVGALVGAGVFAIATALAWNAWSMIAFRTLSTSAGSACGPAAMAYINRLFAPTERVKPLSYWSFVGAGAPVIGVVAGAALVESIGWRIIFWVQAPLCVLAALGGLWLLPRTERVAEARFDAAGSITLGISAVSLLAAISEGPRWGWANPRTVVLFAVFVLMLAVFIQIERRVSSPLVVMRWFRTRNVALPVLGLMFAQFCYMGAFILAPQMLIRGLGMSEGSIAGIITSRPIAFALMAPVAGLLAIRLGERLMGIGGMLMMITAMLMWVPLTSKDQTLLLIAALVVSGLAMGTLSPSLTSLTANAVDTADIGVAGAMQQLMMQLGSVLGAVVMTTVALSGNRAELGPFHHAFIVAAGVGVVGLAVCWFVRSTPRSASSNLIAADVDVDDPDYDDVLINP